MFILTGASGYIGSHYLSHFRRTEQKVISLSGTEFYNIAIKDEEDFVRSAIFQADTPADQYIFLNAGWKNVKRQGSAKFDKEFIDKQIRLHKILMKIGVKKFVNFGTCYEYGKIVGGVTPEICTDPIINYAMEKYSLYRKLIELVSENSSIEILWMRIFYVYGGEKQNNNIFDSLRQCARDGKAKFNMTYAEQQLDFIHVEDLVKSSLRLLTKKNINGLINASSGEPQRLRTMIEKFISDNELNLKIEYGALPYREHESMVLWGDRPFELFEHKVD